MVMSLKTEVSSTIKPGDDFFGYANQKWIDAHPIPADKAQYGTFDILGEDNLKKLIELLKAPIDSNEPQMVQLVKRYYQAAMDEKAIQTSTPKLVEQVIKQVSALSSRQQLKDYIIKRNNQGFGLVWSLIIEPDDKDCHTNVLRLWQGGLGLPERTYYLEDAPQFVEVRHKYIEFMTQLFELVRLDKPKERAQQVFDLEVELAKASLKAADLRDPVAMYNPYTDDKLNSEFPIWDWETYRQGLDLGASKIIIGQPQFITAATRLIQELPIEQWQNYLLLNHLVILGSKLSKPFEDLNFSFFGKVLGGREKQEPRDLRVSRQCMAILPQPIGRLYVEHYFDETAKAEIKDLVEHLEVAFEKRLDQLEWMSDKTKQQARHKLSTFLPLLGYPDDWRSFDDLKLGDSFADNFLATCKFEWQYEIDKLKAPVDRTEWLMSPALVNAYYWPNTNGITFPAGILQPPYFDANGDFAANYGGIGAVIGHEITHGFDDQGSQFDAEGNLKTWWQDSDRKDFDSRAQQLAKQYSSYKVAGRNVDGQLTLGENIADLGGLLIAYDAMRAKLAEIGEDKLINGFTADQRFFLSYALNWCRVTRKQLALERLVSDPHSPELYRVNGAVVNVDNFYDAFAVQPGDKLYIAPKDRVRIW